MHLRSGSLSISNLPGQGVHDGLAAAPPGLGRVMRHRAGLDLLCLVCVDAYEVAVPSGRSVVRAPPQGAASRGPNLNFLPLSFSLLPFRLKLRPPAPKKSPMGLTLRSGGAFGSCDADSNDIKSQKLK